MKSMKLLEETNDNRNIKLDDVGIRGMLVPMMVGLGDGNKSQWVVACNFTQQLAEDERGVNMTKLAQFIQGELACQELDQNKRRAITKALVSLYRPALLELTGKVFIPVVSPISKYQGLLDCDLTCQWVGSGESIVFQQELTVPVVTSCPGSKELAKVSAHSQRGYTTLGLQDSETTILEMFTVISSNVSALVFPVLSGEDDAVITVAAYENGKFVEDVVKDIVLDVQNNMSGVPYFVRSIHHESIHNHQAFAKKKHELYVKAGGRSE